MIEPVSLDMACGAAYLSVNTQWGVTADLESVSVQLLVHGDLSCYVLRPLVSRKLGSHLQGLALML